MKDFFLLDAVLSTKIITAFYWLMLIGVLFGSFHLFSDGSKYGFNADASIILSIFTLIFGVIIARLIAEFWVVIFKIQQNTRRTADLLEKIFNKQNPL